MKSLQYILIILNAMIISCKLNEKITLKTESKVISSNKNENKQFVNSFQGPVAVNYEYASTPQNMLYDVAVIFINNI